MAGFGNYLEDKQLDWIFKSTAFGTSPAELYISLHSADPGDTGASELTRVDGAYYPVQLDPDPNNSTNTNWNAKETVGTARRMSNKVDISFAGATADWNGAAAIKYWGLWDGLTPGNFLLGGSVNGVTGVIVLQGNTLKFTGADPTGSLTFTVD